MANCNTISGKMTKMSQGKKFLGQQYISGRVFTFQLKGWVFEL